MPDVDLPLPATPQVSARVHALFSQMTLDEKLAQIVGYWLDQNGTVAPMQSEMTAGQKDSGLLGDITKHGIGQYTRVYGTRPVDPVERAAWLWNEQRRLKRETRLGIPAVVHEECLTGLAAWKAATYPTPLAWGATFNPEIVEEMGAAIGGSMRTLGIHQGLAPVLDVVRDPRWGRVDECIGEDPYLVGTVGTAFVKGLQSEGVHATLKHLVGYPASDGGRNHGPVAMGPREIADIYLPPFEMAIRDGNARSVMNSYSTIDNVPVAADESLLTGVLREQWGFDGIVVADYFAVAFLEVMHRVAADRGEAAALALRAGIDVELPTGDAYLEPLADLVRSGGFDERYIDRSVLRVLAHKEELGLLDPDAFEDEPPTSINLDTPAHRDLARRMAAESLVLLSNDGTLPFGGLPGAPTQAPTRIAVVGPNSDRTAALMGCYSFINHVLAHHPGTPDGIDLPTVAEAIAEAFPDAAITRAEGCAVDGEDRTAIPAAVDAASVSDVVVAVVGDQAGLFGRGTVGEGNDVQSLALPGVQRELVEALVATGTPVVLVVITGRPYELAWALEGDGPRPAAVIQAFFPGEEGGHAIADLIAGVTAPSGRLPVSLPRSVGAQPFRYMHPVLGGPSDVTATDPSAVRPFGFGLSYTTFVHSDLVVDETASTDGSFTASVTVTNTGSVDATDVVQLYGHDVVGSLPRPVVQLLGYARVPLAAGESARVAFDVPAARLAFTNRDLRRVVEPGAVEVWVADHSASPAPAALADSTGGAIRSIAENETYDVPGSSTPRLVVELTGPVHEVTSADARIVGVRVATPDAALAGATSTEEAR